MLSESFQAEPAPAFALVDREAACSHEVGIPGKSWFSVGHPACRLSRTPFIDAKEFELFRRGVPRLSSQVLLVVAKSQDAKLEVPSSRMIPSSNHAITVG